MGRPGVAQSRPSTAQPSSWNEGAMRVRENPTQAPICRIRSSADRTSRWPCPAPRHSGSTATRSIAAAATAAPSSSTVRGITSTWPTIRPASRATSRLAASWSGWSTAAWNSAFDGAAGRPASSWRISLWSPARAGATWHSSSIQAGGLKGRIGCSGRCWMAARFFGGRRLTTVPAGRISIVATAWEPHLGAFFTPFAPRTD